MNARTLAVTLGAVVAITAFAFAFASQSSTPSTPRDRPRPIAGILSEAVPNVPDAPLADAARAFFTSLLERQYRAHAVPIDSATPTLAARLQALPVAGRADLQPTIVTIRYAQKLQGVRQVTVQVDQHLADKSTQPLAANFRKLDGTWRATSLSILDADTNPDSTNARPGREAPGAATRAVRAYALAARSWTPDTLRATYEQQLRLSVGPLHSALLRSAPTAAVIAAYRAGRQRMTATIRDVQLVSVTADAITFSVVLAERTVSAGAPVQTQRTVNTAQLQRRGAHWLVSGFTATP